VIQAMERAWNDGDSQRFASYFAEDADLVNIHGMRLRGRGSIAGLYSLLFRGVFADSRVNCNVSRSRSLCEGAALLQLKIEIRVRAGQLAGDHEAMSSVVLQRENAEWQVTSLQNTLIGPAAL
jgi:uncharacterized protein (TIGR02246 family)